MEEELKRRCVRTDEVEVWTETGERFSTWTTEEGGRGGEEQRKMETKREI